MKLTPAGHFFLFVYRRVGDSPIPGAGSYADNQARHYWPKGLFVNEVNLKIETSVFKIFDIYEAIHFELQWNTKIRTSSDFRQVGDLCQDFFTDMVPTVWKLDALA